MYRITVRNRFCRVPLASLEEWVIVNQRKGKGEGTEGCDSPRPPPSTVTTELKDPGESGVEFSSSGGGGNDAGNGSGDAAEDAGGGQRHTRGRSMRKRRRGLGGLSEGPHGAAGGGAERTEEKEGEGAGGGRVACDRAGPGEVTADGHPFHLHVNHFQVRKYNTHPWYDL